MKSKTRRIGSTQATDPLHDSRLMNVRVRYLKNLVSAFLAEVDAIGSDTQFEFGRGFNLRDEVRRFEIDLIKYALQQTRGHQAHAARLLGLNATTLNSKVKLYGLQTQIFRRVAECDPAPLDHSAHRNSVPEGPRATALGSTAFESAFLKREVAKLCNIPSE